MSIYCQIFRKSDSNLTKFQKNCQFTVKFTVKILQSCDKISEKLSTLGEGNGSTLKYPFFVREDYIADIEAIFEESLNANEQALM